MKNKVPAQRTVAGLLSPYFDIAYGTPSHETGAPAGRLKRFKQLFRLQTEFFSNAKQYEDLDNARLWKEFQRSLAGTYSMDRLRILTQDTNKILYLLHQDGKIGPIRLSPVKRKIAASAGFAVQKLMNFDTEDIARIWEIIRENKDVRYPLLFASVLCSAMPVRHLVHLRVSDISESLITVSTCGLVTSLLVEPARTMLLKYIDNSGLAHSDRVFRGMQTDAFTKWLNKQCKKAFVRPISSITLFHYARFLLVLQGVQGYVAYSLGSKNAFSPFLTSTVVDKEEQK